MIFLWVCRCRRSRPLGPTAASVLLTGVIHVQPRTSQLLHLLLLLQQDSESEDWARSMEDTQRSSSCAPTPRPNSIPLWPPSSPTPATGHLPRPIWPLWFPTWTTTPPASSCRHSCSCSAGCWPQETRGAAALVWKGEGSAGGRKVGVHYFLFNASKLFFRNN